MNEMLLVRARAWAVASGDSQPFSAGTVAMGCDVRLRKGDSHRVNWFLLGRVAPLGGKPADLKTEICATGFRARNRKGRALGPALVAQKQKAEGLVSSFGLD